MYIAALRVAPLSLVQATPAGGAGLLALAVRAGGGALLTNAVPILAGGPAALCGPGGPGTGRSVQALGTA